MNESIHKNTVSGIEMNQEENRKMDKEINKETDKEISTDAGIRSINTLASKMTEVMKECGYVAKNGENSFHGYRYASCADVLEKVNASLVRHGICSAAMPELISMENVKSAKGTAEHLATVSISILLTDSESGETMSISGIGSGQDSGDKAVMKAQTAAIKYAYMLSLAVSTGDDPEKEEEAQDQHQNQTSFPASVKSKTQKADPKSRKPLESVCSLCGAGISEKVRQYSESRYGRPLCMNCQKKTERTA